MAELIDFPEAAWDLDEWREDVPTAPVGDLFPEAPADWQRLPATLEVGFRLLPGQCVSQILFDEYRADTIAEAVDKAIVHRADCIFVHYRLAAVRVAPLIDWYVSRGWESRGLRGGGFAPRESIQGPVPWEYDADSTLLEIFNKPINSWTGRCLLRVGGRGRSNALARWHQCAGPIRELAAAGLRNKRG